jgi:mannosyltransferase OCH1-like enzyme
MKGYYINLECRRDRRRHIENNILTLDFFKDLERFEGIKNEELGMGCGESWVKIIEKCIEIEDQDYFLLIEDDISIDNDDIFNKFLKDFEEIKEKEWDVITLTPHWGNGNDITLDNIFPKYYDNFYKIKWSFTMTGLIIKKSFLPIFLKNQKDGLKLLKEKKDDKLYKNDIYWHSLQEEHTFLCYQEDFCSQLDIVVNNCLNEEVYKHTDQWNTHGRTVQNKLKSLLLRYINNPHNDYNCFYLAREYEIEGQLALAVSYYLKCCDNTKYDELAYESLIRIGYCLGGMDGRDEKGVSAYEHAISILPDRPEAYYILSLHYSWRNNFKKGYMYSQLAIHNSDIKNYPLYFETQYKGVNHSLFQKAYTGSKIGRITESIEIYEDLLNKDIDDNLRNIINNNLNYIYPIVKRTHINCKTQDNYKTQENKKNIPKIIHQTWEYKYNELNEDMKVYVDSWKTHNNNYEHNLYDKNDRISFIKDNFDDNVLNSYNKLKPGAFKCDLWRYCILYIYGGYYVDLDTLCLDSLDKLPCANFLCSIDISWNEKGTYQLANGFIGSNKGNPILKMCIDYIVEIVMSDKIEMIYPIDIAGPGCLGICMNKYLGNNPKSSFTEYGYIDDNNIYLLNFDKDTEYMGISNENIWILQNKNGNMSLKKSYDNECKKIKDYFDWGKFGHGLVFKKNLLNDLSVINKNLPQLIVIDNFYKDPDSIRKKALDLDFLSEEYHGAVGFRCEKGRLVSDEVKDYFEKILGGKIKMGSNIGEWSYSTNGCFQWCSKDTRIVYHSDSQEYAGIVFLTPDAPVNCGTSIFRHKKYKIKDNSIWSKPDWSEGNIMTDPHLDKNLWEEVDRIGNIYNRLVIFKSHNVHAVSEYFGETINDSRLFQLFFFDIE